MMYSVFMLKDNLSTVEKRFMSYVWTQEHGGVNFSEYETVYTGHIELQENESVQDVLERLYTKHNAPDRPEDHHTRSMSVSDLVALEGIGTFFCDSFGFKKIN